MSRSYTRPHTRIRRMWAQVDPGPFRVLPAAKRLPMRSDYDSTPTYIPVLVVPCNPTARLAMIRRTVATLWPRAKGAEREKREALVLHVLGTALTPR